MFRTTLSAVFTAALLVGCGTPRLAATASEAPPAQWQATLPHGGDAQALADWWRRFDDPLVADLVAEAQRTSPTLAQALARLAQARAGVRGAAAQRWPSVNAGAQASRGTNATSGFVAATTGSAGLDAAWEVDLFGATRAQVAAAEARGDAAALGWHGARISLAADVAAAYVALRACEAQLQVAEQDAASQRQTATLTGAKVRVGFEAPANGALADGAAADATNRAIAQRADCDVLVKGLVVLTGAAEPALRTRLAAGTARLPQPAAFAVGALPAALLQQRPDIAAAERALVAAAADVGVAEAARFPRLTFSGTLALSAWRAGGQTSDGTAWGFGPALVLPIFDGGARAAREDAAHARYDEARAALDERVRRAVADVEEALVRLDAATRREGEAERAAQGFRDFFSAAEQRWRIGAGSLIDREDARRTALAAQTALINVQRERVAAWITLYRALGGGWSAADATPRGGSTRAHAVPDAARK
ncbi:MAG TPA: efflux transporter outer membrane subunit [Burkholderiaceae bacterium]|nr:efflux transporter outer membrane subunit [Burkholderiaceae bacterium]